MFTIFTSQSTVCCY